MQPASCASRRCDKSSAHCRLTETRPTGATTYTYDAADELTQAAGPSTTTTYSYDGNGNQTAAGTTTRSYDLANRLTSATVGSVTTNYTFDGDGNRLTATTGTTTTKYLWDTNNDLPQLATETDGTGATLRDYIQGTDTAALLEGGNTYYYHHNALGSVTALTKSDGTREWTYTYEPFGNPKTTTKNDPNAPVNPLQYVGQYLDTNTDLYDLRARQYDPTTGLFTSVDPTPAGPSSAYETPYDYADQDPINGYDLNGLACTDSDTLLRCGLATSLGALVLVSGACASMPTLCLANKKIRPPHLHQSNASGIPTGAIPPPQGLRRISRKEDIPYPALSKAFHRIKRGAGLKPGDKTKIDSEGNVYDVQTGEDIGNVIDEAGAD